MFSDYQCWFKFYKQIILNQRTKNISATNKNMTVENIEWILMMNKKYSNRHSPVQITFLIPQSEMCLLIIALYIMSLLSANKLWTAFSGMKVKDIKTTQVKDLPSWCTNYRPIHITPSPLWDIPATNWRLSPSRCIYTAPCYSVLKASEGEN